ncbi:MAG: hypothetical protein ACKO87_10325 [Dolichospermum sp.]
MPAPQEFHDSTLYLTPKAIPVECFPIVPPHPQKRSLYSLDLLRKYQAIANFVFKESS